MSVGSNVPAMHQAPNNGLLHSLRPVLGPLLLFSCMTNLLIGIGPLFMLQVVDRVLPSGNTATLIALMLLALIALGIMAVLEHLRGIMMTRASAWWERQMTQKLLPLAIHGQSSASKISTNIFRVGTFLVGAPLQAVLDAPWAFLFFGFAYLIHPTLAAVGLAVAATAIVLAIAGHLFGQTAMKLAILSRMQANGLVHHLDQNRKLLSTMGIAPNLIKLQHAFLRESHEHQKRSAEADQARRVTAKFLRAAMQILVLGTGAWLVLAGELSGGAMVASSILLTRALAPIEQLAGSLPAFVDFRLACRELNVVIQAQSDAPPATILPEFSNKITCENLTVATAPGAPPILNQISVAFDKGTCVAVMGASGAGKTTLVELLAGASSPTYGSVKIDGADLRQWSNQERSRMIGFLPQQPILFPGTVAENIARFDPDAEHDDVLRAAVAAGAHGMIVRLPEGYSTRISFESSVLSGGEQQRIAMARALYKSPQILVLDEPNAALDKEGERALIATLTNQKKAGVTVIMVAHRAGILGVADHVLLLDTGRIRDSGSKAEVVGRMNARMQQIDLEREPAEASRLEDWISSHFKREHDAEARSTAAMIATEMFNISLSSDRKQDENKPIRFTLKHRRGDCTISMLDTCELIASSRIEKLRRIADDDMYLAPVLEGQDLALLMVMQLSESLEQKRADHGRVIQARISTPIRDDEPELRVLN